MRKKLIAHSVFATSCELNFPDIASARRSSCPSTRSPGFLPIVANAHSVFAMPCELNSPDIASARRSSCPIILSPGFVPVVAYAHSVFATSWELNSPDIASARRSSANRRGPVALYLCFAIMCRVLANLSCFAGQTPPVFAMPESVIWERFPAFSGLGGKLWTH